jgi:hypothetical protein
MYLSLWSIFLGKWNLSLSLSLSHLVRHQDLLNILYAIQNSLAGLGELDPENDGLARQRRVVVTMQLDNSSLIVVIAQESSRPLLPSKD